MSDVRLLRPRAHTVTGIQYTGHNADRVIEFTEGSAHFRRGTLHVAHQDVFPGDWVIKTTFGFYRVVRGGVKEETFEDAGKA